MKKNLFTLLALVCALALLAACGAPASTPAAPTPAPVAGTTAPDASPVGDVAPVATGANIVIYTNAGSNGRQEWLTEKAAEVGFNITVVHIAGGDLTNRIIAEKNNQVADMIFGLNAMEFERLKGLDLLLPYTPTWVDEVDMNLGDSENGLFYPLVIQPLFMIHNAEALPVGEAPTSWEDLATNEAFAKKYTITRLSSGTGQSLMAGVLVRYLDENGTYGVSDEGWALMKSLIQNGILIASDQDDIQELVDNTYPISMTYGSRMIQKRVDYDFEAIEAIIPEYGVPYVVEQAAIFNGTKNAAECEAFINWLGSAEIQAAWSEEFVTIPSNQGAISAMPAEVITMMEQATAQDIDWGIVSENIEKWMEKIELEFVQ